MIRTLITHHQRLNALGVLVATPGGRKLRLISRLMRQNVSGEQIIGLLKRLLRLVPGEIVLVWDNHPIHRRRMVQAFIAQHKRLHVFHFPAYAPELNPAEGLWVQAKEYTAGKAPLHIRALYRLVYTALKRTAKSQRRLRACIKGTRLPWL